MARAPFNRNTQKIVDGIVRVFETFDPPLTVRMIFYQCATKLGLVQFSEKGYSQICYLTLRMRRLGVVPWNWFADRTRKVEQVAMWNGVDDFMESVRHSYRRDLWEKQPERIEIWLEKDAMAGFFKAALGPYRVGLYTIRGFSSKTFIYEAAEAIKRADKPTHIYYFGDHDPSGLAIEWDVQESIAEFGGNVASFERVGVTLDQARDYDLPLLNVKRSDSRAPKYIETYGQHTVELDAMPPDDLRRMITDCVDKHIDRHEWRALLKTEEMEQETIRNFTERFFGGGGA